VRLEACFAAHAPKRGKRGTERQSHGTDHQSATRPTAPGVIQGDKGHAVGAAQDPVIGHAEAFGNGHEAGPVSPMREGAKDPLTSIGLPEASVAGQRLSAASHDHREAKLPQWAQDTLDASSPEPHVRQRDPRFATQDRPQAPRAENLTVAELTDDREHAWDRCPPGKGRHLAARRPKSDHNSSRSDEADAAACGGGLRREPCVPHAETPRNHLAVLVEQAQEPLSQQLIANSETPAARKMYGVRLAMVEPVFGQIRSPKRVDRCTWRGKLNVKMQWRRSCLVHTIEKSVHSGLAA
jgi:Transposase DDE domain